MTKVNVDDRVLVLQTNNEVSGKVVRVNLDHTLDLRLDNGSLLTGIKHHSVEKGNSWYLRSKDEQLSPTQSSPTSVELI